MITAVYEGIRSYVRTFAGRLFFLFIIFLIVPILLYGQLAGADRAKNELLLKTIQAEGEIVARSLRPVFDAFQNVDPASFQAELDGLRKGQRNIKVLYRPQEEEKQVFFYIASSPRLTADLFDQERVDLLDTGIFENLSPSCEGDNALAVRFQNALGDPELLTSITPMIAGERCWVVITSHSSDALLQASLTKPFYMTRGVQIAGLVYVLLAIIVLWLFADVWQNLRGFRDVARTIRLNDENRRSFESLTEVPELRSVAGEIDQLVDALQRSKNFIRQAAEDNAHALKAPLAVISQALEPLKRAINAGDTRMERSVDLIERSVDRLDALVSASRDLETQVADTLDPTTERLNLTELIRNILESYKPILSEEEITLNTSLVPNIFIQGNDELLETVMENLIDNAISFSAKGAQLSVSMEQEDSSVRIRIVDEGPGVDPNRLGAIFNRYVSFREGAPAQSQEIPDEKPTWTRNFGIGLWIVRRNVEVLGGEVSAQNREPNGLEVAIILPLAAH